MEDVTYVPRPPRQERWRRALEWLRKIGGCEAPDLLEMACSYVAEDES